MKKLLTMLGAITLTTTASTSVIACKKEPTEAPEAKETAIKLNEQVAKDLGLIDENGESLVKAKINYYASTDYVNWNFEGKTPNISIRYFKATNLLKDDDTDIAISPESEYFLINTLKLTKDDKGKFKKYDTDAITLSISEIKLTLSKTEDGSGYEVTGGTFKLQFLKGAEKLGDNYTIDLKGNELNVKSILENFIIVYRFFNPIPGLKVGEHSNNFELFKKVDAYTFLKKESAVYKKLDSLNNLLINTGDKISIKPLSINFEEDNSFADTGFWQDSTNNYLLLSLNFGTITADNNIKLYPSL